MPPMFVTLLGIVTDIRLSQQPKAIVLILVTLSGIVTDVRLLHPKKAKLPMFVTPYSMATSGI